MVYALAVQGLDAPKVSAEVPPARPFAASHATLGAAASPTSVKGHSSSPAA